MADEGPLLGVTAPTPTPTGEPKPAEPPPVEPLPWSASMQWCIGVLVAIFLIVGSWHGAGLFPISPGRTDIERMPLRIDLNRANKAELRAIPGIGERLAEQILAHRQTHGDFRSVDDLAHVPGIGPATQARLRDYFWVSPYRSEEKPAPVVRAAMPEEKKAPAKLPKTKKPTPDEALDVNKASERELQQLPGIGPTLAARIVEGRPFASVEDLRKVKGIGVKTLEKIRPHVRVVKGER